MLPGLAGIAGLQGASVAATPTILDTRDVSSAITLSGANLIATKNNTAAHAYAFGRHGKSSGKWRFQVTVNALGGTDIGIGIANPMFINQASYLGSDNYGAGIGSGAGLIITGGSSVLTTSSYGAGDVIDVYVDVPLARVWFAKNGTVLSGVVGVSGGLALTNFTALYPAVNLYYNNSAVTFNFGATAFTYASLNGAFLPWTDAEDYSRTNYRRIGVRLQTFGWFAWALAEFKVRDTTGGATTATGGTAIAEGVSSGKVAANMFNGVTSDWWEYTNNSGVANQLPSWCGYDFGADASRSTQYIALQSRDGGGGAQDQAPRTFIIMVGGQTSWYKNSFQTTGAWSATTPGDIREFTLS